MHLVKKLKNFTLKVSYISSFLNLYSFPANKYTLEIPEMEHGTIFFYLEGRGEKK